MGKSLGNVLEPGPLVRAYGADAVRLYFTKEVLFGQVRPRVMLLCLTAAWRRVQCRVVSMHCWGMEGGKSCP